MLGGHIVSEGVFDESLHVDLVRDLEEEGQEYMSSRLVKTVSGVGYAAGSLKFLSKSPFKRPAGVAFVVKEEENLTCEVSQSG